MAQGTLTEDEVSEIREVFSHYDTDGNGVIDRNEFAHLLDALDAQLTPEELSAGLEALDANNNGKIDFDEFLVWWSDR